MSEVKINHVYKRYGSITVVDDFNLEVKDGEFISILGPSGCGKTTTLRMVAGFERATEGTISIGDTVVSSSEQGIFVPPEKRGIGMVFQSYAVWPHMTVADNVGYPLKIQHVPTEERKKRVAEMLELVHLGEYSERFPSQLSGGQQQRVALARALVMRPGLLLLDEPLSNLDAKLRESMRFEISAIQKKMHITVIYVTHDQSEAMAMSDRVVVMSAGVVQQIGHPHDIYSNPVNKMVADFIGLVNFVKGSVQGDRVFIEGTEVSFPNTNGVSGDNVTFAVRPENITISKTAGALAGVVRHSFFLGDSTDFRIECGKHMFRVIVKGVDATAFPDDTNVFLDFSKVMLF